MGYYLCAYITLVSALLGVGFSIGAIKKGKNESRVNALYGRVEKMQLYRAKNKTAPCELQKTVFECKPIKFSPPNAGLLGIWAHLTQGLLTQVPAAFENYMQPRREIRQLDFWQSLRIVCADFAWKKFVHRGFSAS